tara:strand:- start:436 stop:888 length:453 start_codon:yes stop_codon:yes gene_type:complete
MSTTVDSSENQSVRVQRVTGELARIAKLEDALSDFEGSTVNLIEEENHTIVTCSSKPVGRTERSHTLIYRRKAEKVALSHLTSATFDNRHSECGSVLIDHRGLTNTVTTTEQDGVIRTGNVRKDEKKILEINSHCISLVAGASLPRPLFI